ncbi:tryptophan-rich sensory protein [Leptolyngbya sp. PCC 7375]|nr:tryptophan-rich sensory protein [Leptolyngbya sp. PCC 7375]
MIDSNGSKLAAIMAEKTNLFGKVESMVNAIMGVRLDDATQLPAAEGRQADWSALGGYVVGTLAQIGLMIISLWGLQQLTQEWSETVKVGAAIAFFIVLAIRSRLFSPLNNARTRTTYSNVQRPGWAPPPLAFPIIWMSIGVLRVVSSYLVWQALGQTYLTWPLAIFIIHLALGDTWNTVFTVEGRLGLAVPVVILGPLVSSVVVTLSYWQVVPLAGQLLLPMVIWLAVASTLVISIWQLNDREPWYPLMLDEPSQG